MVPANMADYRGIDKRHPAPFPLELATRIVQMFSFAGDTVLDPFCGTGTTMAAAMQNQRNSIGVEIDDEYCRMAYRELQQERSTMFSETGIVFEEIHEKNYSVRF